ncbi:MAG: hypothetical protein V7785_00740 [Bermanella sp.]
MDMNAFGIIGMIFGMAALYRIHKLEKALKSKGVLEQDFTSHK